MATHFEIPSRMEEINSKYSELLELLRSSGYELRLDDCDLDVTLTNGEFMFTLAHLPRY